MCPCDAAVARRPVALRRDDRAVHGIGEGDGSDGDRRRDGRDRRPGHAPILRTPQVGARAVQTHPAMRFVEEEDLDDAVPVRQFADSGLGRWIAQGCLAYELPGGFGIVSAEEVFLAVACGDATEAELPLDVDIKGERWPRFEGLSFERREESARVDNRRWRRGRDDFRSSRWQRRNGHRRRRRDGVGSRGGRTRSGRCLLASASTGRENGGYGDDD